VPNTALQNTGIIKMYKIASINYIVIDNMIIIILTSSRPKSSICLDYVQCTRTNVSLFDSIQGDSVAGARVGVYRALVGLNKKYIYNNMHAAKVKIYICSIRRQNY
jgi:hypothetical protein